MVRQSLVRQPVSEATLAKGGFDNGLNTLEIIKKISRMMQTKSGDVSYIVFEDVLAAILEAI